MKSYSISGEPNNSVKMCIALSSRNSPEIIIDLVDNNASIVLTSTCEDTALLR